MKPIPLFLLIAVIALALPAAAEPVTFNESIAGDRNLGQYFTWSMQNVSGTYAHSTYHYTVYDYRILGENYTYYSVNWGQWFTNAADPGKEYLAVWVRGWMDGTTYFGWGQDRFRVWVNGQTISPEPVMMQDIALRNHRVTASGKAVSTSACGNTETATTEDLSGTSLSISTGRYLPVVIREVEDLKARIERSQLTTERFGWKDEIEMDRMEPGWSAKFDGYILYQIPMNADLNDIRIAGDFRNYGTATWNLVEKEIDQVSIERYQQMEKILHKMEIDSGLRIPDKPIGRIKA